jgi:hypothetical protein
MRLFFYIVILAILNCLIAVAEWGSIYLSLIILITYFLFRPKYVFHPNNMIFAFYGLYVVLSSTINFVLDYIKWEYVLPWGQLIFWDTFSKYTLFQAEFTFLILYFSFNYFAPNCETIELKKIKVNVNKKYLKILYIITLLLVILFIETTAGLNAWIGDYSMTYLTKREGHGLLNVVVIVMGNITTFLLGVKCYYSKDRKQILFYAFILICALSFVNGIKSRFIFLLIVFFSPYLMSLRFKSKSVVTLGLTFIVLLYFGTLIRTEGFYSTGPFFLEMLVGYFNSFQLHDYVVKTRDPAIFGTVWQVLTKPMQMLGLVGPDTDFDISVMLTKEFFPDQWYKEHATQQWPLDTEMYLNYYGFYFSWIILGIYAFFVSQLYKLAIVDRNFYFMPIYFMEFMRIFSTMRGTIVPWEVFIYIGQYLLIYLICRLTISFKKSNQLL